jgi:hypothetical protein
VLLRSSGLVFARFGIEDVHYRAPLTLHPRVSAWLASGEQTDDPTAPGGDSKLFGELSSSHVRWCRRLPRHGLLGDKMRASPRKPSISRKVMPKSLKRHLVRAQRAAAAHRLRSFIIRPHCNFVQISPLPPLLALEQAPKGCPSSSHTSAGAPA